MAERKVTDEEWDKICNKVISSNKLPFDMERLAEQCILGEYVLVLGSDIMLDRTKKPGDGYDGNSELFLTDRAKAKYPGTSLLKGICLFLKEIDDSKMLTSASLNPTLKKLLNQRCFRTIVTTAYDPFLEMFLNDLWQYQYRVLNINTDGKRDIRKDISSYEIRPNEFNKTVPMLYYAFGKAEHRNLASNSIINEFAATDNEKMKIVAQWLSNQAPRNFLKHLKHKRILAIGCKFDDWLFRFFWYMLHKDINLLTEGEVVFDYHEDTDARLKDYLNSQRIEIFENAQEFMINLRNAILKVKKNAVKDLRNGQSDRLKTLGDKGVFISYAHEDFWIVYPLYNKLIRLGFNVWMDVRLEASDKYDLRIESAIKQCRVFIPILSSTVKQTLESGECHKRYFYNKEWAIAENRINAVGELEEKGDDSMHVLPILVDSFEIDQNYENRLKSFIKTSHSYDIGKQKIEILVNKLIELTKNESDE